MDQGQMKSGQLPLPDELRRLRECSPEAAYLFRLVCLSLIGAGLDPSEAGGRLAVSERTLRRWLALYRSRGTAGLAAGLHSGRPCDLGAEQAVEVLEALRGRPSQCGLNATDWSGPLVGDDVGRRFGIRLGLRQCQRLLSRARQVESAFGEPWPGP